MHSECCSQVVLAEIGLRNRDRDEVSVQAGKALEGLRPHRPIPGQCEFGLIHTVQNDDELARGRERPRSLQYALRSSNRDLGPELRTV